MNIEKLPSGSYRAKKIYKGKTYRVTFDHKPTQKEVLQALAEKMDADEIKDRAKNFERAALEYIESKSNVLSPSTIVGYKSSLRNLSDHFKSLNVNDITNQDIQKEINDYSAPYHPVNKNTKVVDESKLVTRSPKTVRNAHGFISAVLATLRPNLNCSCTLPQKLKSEPYIPSDEDVKKILSEVADTEYETAYKLLCFGLRRSELIAVTDKSIEIKDGRYILHIKEAIVQDENREWKTKTTKTTASTRDLDIPKELAEMILKDGYAFNGHPNTLTCHLTDIQKALGITHFSIHKFRHYFCSKLISEGYDIKTIQALGGWDTDETPRKIYAHVMSDKLDKAKAEATSKIANALF